MTAADFLPAARNLSALREAAAECRGCDLYKNATQTVFGEGLVRTRVVFVGEQPGDKEDLAGRPFVGPAGRLLDKVLDQVGIDRSDVFVTNAVKHFKWEPRGKRRLHKKPGARELKACRPWLEAELDVVRPEFLICLGATAAQSVLGRDYRITQQHGEIVETSFCDHTLATWHPSAVLRAPDDEARARMRGEFADDLRHVAALLTGAGSGRR